MYLLYKDPEGSSFNSEPSQNIGVQAARTTDECLKTPPDNAQPDANMTQVIIELRSENSMLKVTRLHQCGYLCTYLFCRRSLCPVV